MITFKPAARVTILLTIIVFMMPSFIVSRHDKLDKEYLELGEKFPEVGKVGQRGGDGTLIASNWVVTAAHVAEGMYQKFGKDFNIFFNGKAYEIESIFIYPEFSPMGPHDVALVKLKSDVTGIKPVDLYRNNDEQGKDIVLVGHGDFKTGNEREWKMDGKRRAATNRVNEANPLFIIYRFDSPDSKEVTELEGTAGRGDSGGPAFILEGEKKFVAGISSAGTPGENGPGTYGAVEHYTRISTHLNWIDNVLQGKIKEFNGQTLADQQPRPGKQQGALQVFQGLGLFLRQGDNQIVIEGKIDQEVPREFREVIFGNGSYIISLNGKKYHSLDLFSKDFNAIKGGISYEIVFSVKGQIQKFDVVR